MLSRDGACSNPLGCGPSEPKQVKLICPFDGCDAGKNGKPFERRPQDISRLRTHLALHLKEGFSPSDLWLSKHDSQLCPGCDHAIVSLSSRCAECRARVSDAQFKLAAPRARGLPKLQQNHVVQLSLGATEVVLSKGLPPRASTAKPAEEKLPPRARTLKSANKQFVIEKVIGKRRVNSKVEYLVVWEGYSSEHDSWEPISSFKNRRVQAIDDFESTYIPPRCVKNANDVCSCGDTGCDGPDAENKDHYTSSSSGTSSSTIVPSVVNKQVIPTVSSAAVVKSQVFVPLASVAGVKKQAIPDSPPQRNRLKHPIHVPGDGKCQPPAQSLLARKLALSDIAPSAVSLEEKKASSAVPTEEKRSAQPVAKVALSEEKKAVARSCSISLMDICRLDTPLVKRVPNSQRAAFAREWGSLLDQAVHSGQVGNWTDFFIFPKCILWTPVRGGKRLSKKTNMAAIVKTRLTRWKSEPDSLWREVVERSKKPLMPPEPRKPKTDGTRLEEAVIAALRLGDVRKALQMLNSAPIAAKTPATLACLRKLHPQGENPAPVPHQEVPRFTEDVVRTALCSFGPGSAAGLFGYKPFLLQQCVRAESFFFTRALTSAVNEFACGRAPSFLKRYVAGGVSIALEKTKTSVRPLACGDPIRRLVAKCFCVGGKEEISKAFAGRNYGVGCPGGVEVVAHSLRDCLQQHKGSKLALLKIDFRNAFNEVKRSHFVKAASEMFPAMSSWTEWCYGEASMLFYDHEHIIESCAGVQQGDPLGPLYFCCGIMAMVNDIQAMNPVYNKWYMDDGGIIGDVELLKKVWDLLQTRGPELGLHLNPSKCEWSWLDPDCNDPCLIRLDGVSEADQVKLVPHSQIQMLGVPLGTDVFVSDFVEKKLLGRLQDTVNRLVEFEDTQAAAYLLRVSFSIVRAVHFMRTTPLAQWQEQASKFDAMIRSAIERILGFPMDDPTFAQACLTPRLGGLGLRKVVEHADLAYHASWHESKKVAKEEWTPPANLPPEYLSQKDASFAFDEKMHTYLVDQADTRGAQRLRRAAQPHACGFVTAVPSDEDGKETLLRPRNFAIAVAYRLGVPVLDQEIPCPLCKQPLNIFGDHATCCAKKGDVIVRHNSLRNLVDSIGTDALLSPVMEKKGILGNTTGRRPGDVTFQRWADGKALVIDVAVTSPLADTCVRMEEPCEWYAATQKHGKYDASFKDTQYTFSAMVFETLGAVNVEGEEVLRQLFRFAAKRLGREFTSYCGRAWARISCNLQRSVSQAILNRIDGREFPDNIADA